MLSPARRTRRHCPVGEARRVRIETGGAPYSLSSQLSVNKTTQAGRVVLEPLVALAQSRSSPRLRTCGSRPSGRRGTPLDVPWRCREIVEGDSGAELAPAVGGEVASARAWRSRHPRPKPPPRRRHRSAEPAGEAVVVAVVVVGTVTELEAEVGGRLVVEVEQRSELPCPGRWRSRVVEGVMARGPC